MSNSDIDHISNCVFYDSELKMLRLHFKETYDILKRIEKRAERRQTVQISKSLFDYVEKRKTRESVPSTWYDFVLDDYRVCIYRYKGFYSILCVGFDFDYDLCLHYENVGAGKLYGKFDKLDDDCIRLFMRAVWFFLYHVKMLGDLYSDVIPF